MVSPPRIAWGTEMLEGRAAAVDGRIGETGRIVRAAIGGVLLVAVLVIAIPWRTDVRALTPPDPSDQALLERIDAFLESEMRDADIPGLAVAIVADGKVVHTRGFGVADGDGRPVTADTPFQLASLSKAFTAAAILQLVEAGKVELDAPVTRYLPWFRVGTVEQTGRITIRHLLQHTSGIPELATRATSDIDGADAGALERRVRSLSTVALDAEPGERYEYGNVGYEILGLVVQSVAGVPFDEYIGTHIYGPLGMTHSHVLASDAFADGASEGFYRWFGLRTAPWRTAYPRATGPAGVTFSSANDMARWALFQLGYESGTGVLTTSALAQMHERGVQYDERHWYGMGWVVRPLWEALDDPPETGPITDPVPDLVEHGGAWETAHTYIGLVPGRDWGVVVLANINDRTMSTRYYYTELGLLNLLSGGEPPTPRLFEPPLILYGKQLLLGLLALQVAAIAATVWVVRRARGGTAPSWRAILVGAGLALAVDLAVLYLVFVEAPGWFGSAPGAIVDSAPDVGPLMVLMVLLAAIWGPVRTVILGWTGRRARRRAAGAAESV